MLTMSLSEWSKLTVDQRKEWLHQQEPRKLTAILDAINIMLNETKQLNAQLSTVDLPIVNGQVDTYSLLQDMSHAVTNELQYKLVERSV